MAQHDPSLAWQIGDGILVGLLMGGVMGFAIGQPPLLLAIGVALGAAFDSWMNNRQEKVA